MARVRFSLDVDIAAPADRVWSELVDWAAHGDWIPATRSRILEGDGGVGTVFEAVSGYGRLALTDRMRVTRSNHAERAADIEKLGPVLRGSAGFSVTARGSHSMVHWHEDVHVPFLPQLLAPMVEAVSAVLFRLALRRLATLLA